MEYFSSGNFSEAGYITDTFFLIDPDGVIRYANDAVFDLLGYARSEVLNQPFHFLYNGDMFRCSYDLDTVTRNKKIISEGWRYKKDKTPLWVETRLSAIYDQEQKLAGYSCLMINRTAQKEKELAILKREERYRLMVQGVRDYAIFLLDVNGYITTWNEGAQRTKGYRENEIIGKHFSIFYTSEDLQTNKPARELEIALATGKYEEEGWRIKKNGSVFWANVIITALFNENNELIGFSKVTRDLTERKENEEVLRQSEERYRLLVEQLMDYGIFMLDEKGRISSWNEGARRIKGYNADEIIGKYFSIFYPREDILDGKPARELEIARAVGKYEEEGWRLKKNGERFWANVLITAVYNSEGQLVGYSKVTRDLTEKKHTEQALKDSSERYRILTESLQKTNKELSKANEELEQFASIVSHDLQEPLRTIKSFLQLIDLKLGEQEYDNLQVYIGKSVNAANRMKSLIQNLLQYAQLNKSAPVYAYIQVDELIETALKNLQTAVDLSSATITIEAEIKTVWGDRIQLVQVLQNLLSNSLKFVDATAPEIKLKCYESNGIPTFAVSDNGIGIAENDIHKIFEIFRRLNTKKEYPGTGIGLAICKKIVDRHQGRIWVESEKNKGTTFYFSLNSHAATGVPAYEKI